MSTHNLTLLNTQPKPERKRRRKRAFTKRVGLTPYAREIQEQRKRLGLHQSTMAKAVGVGSSTYSRFELGQKEPSRATRAEIARILGLPMRTSDRWFKRDIAHEDERQAEAQFIIQPPEPIKPPAWVGYSMVLYLVVCFGLMTYYIFTGSP